MGIKFTGDPKKAERNLPKHKLSFKTGEQVFGDPFVLIVEDCIDPITGEQRYNAIGRAPSQALLVVSFELPQDRNSALKPSCSKCLVREHIRQPFPAHRLHRNAIRQAVTFVRPSLVESQAFEKTLAALRNDAHIVDRKKTSDGNRRILSQAFTRGAEGQYLSKHFIRGDEDPPTRLLSSPFSVTAQVNNFRNLYLHHSAPFS